MSRSAVSLLWFSLVLPALGVDFKRVCYFPSIVKYRIGITRFQVSNIQPSLCTHVVFAHAGLLHGQIHNQEDDIKTYRALVALKTEHPDLKILLSVGGNENRLLEEMSSILRSKTTRAVFITSCLTVLRYFGFDGLDLYFDHPGKEPYSSPEDKAHFGLLLQEMKGSFGSEAAQNGVAPLLLSVIVNKETHLIREAYDIEQLIKNVDFINVFTYYFHGGETAVPPSMTGHHAPLYEPDPSGLFGTLNNMNYAALYWVRLGVPKDMLVIGLSTFGVGFLLSSADETGLGASVSGVSPAQDYTRKAGFLAYYEVCSQIFDGATVVRSDELQAPYLYKDSLWVGFDDQDSLRNKVRWLKTVGLGGYFVWDMASDDFLGTFCGKGAYPLLTALSKELLAETVPPLQPPSYLFEVKCGQCVNKTSGLDCNPNSTSEYHGCEDGLVWFTGRCPSTGSSVYSQTSSQCVPPARLHATASCRSQLGCGRAPEGTLMDTLGFVRPTEPTTVYDEVTSEPPSTATAAPSTSPSTASSTHVTTKQTTSDKAAIVVQSATSSSPRVAWTHWAIFLSVFSAGFLTV